MDFVLSRGPRLAAVEVKSGARRTRLSGLEGFGEQFGGAATILAGEGGVPLAEFLSVPAQEWLDRPMTRSRAAHGYRDRRGRRRRSSNRPLRMTYFDWGDMPGRRRLHRLEQGAGGRRLAVRFRRLNVSRRVPGKRCVRAARSRRAPARRPSSRKLKPKRAGCHYVTARNFLTLGEKPEWREPDATLFIDGLDEKRAGSQDGRTPLDDIRAKLDSLGRPRFRLSCREADWFGSNDRTHLETVSRDGRLKVLRLDPLSDEGVRALLNLRPDVDDADAFIEEARARGIDHLLTNPQNLKMLADAVSGGSLAANQDADVRAGLREARSGIQLSTIGLRSGTDPPRRNCLPRQGDSAPSSSLTGHAGYATDYGGGDSELSRASNRYRATIPRLFASP